MSENLLRFLPVIILVVGIAVSAWPFALLLRLVAFEDFRAELTRKLLDRDLAHRVPSTYRFRRNGVLPADDPRYWKSDQDFSNWVRKQAWLRLGSLVVFTPIWIFMGVFLVRSFDDLPVESPTSSSTTTTTPAPNYRQTQVVCSQREMPAFFTAVSNPDRDARTPLVVPCSNIGTQTPTR